MSEIGTLLTGLMFIKLTLIDALEAKRALEAYTPKVQKVSVTPDRFARLITLNDISYNGTFWKLNITVSAKSNYDMANDSFNILTPVVSAIVNITPKQWLNPVDATLEVVITNMGSEISIGTLKASETKTFDVAVYDIYPVIDFDLRPLITFHDNMLGVDTKWTGSYKCSMQIPSDNYVEAKKAYLMNTLNDMLGQLADIENKMDSDWQKIEKSLNDWLGDSMPDKLILATLNPALEDYKKLVATAQELSEKIVQFAKANDLQVSLSAYKEIYKPPEQLPSLPPRDKLKARLQQLEADITRYVNILANDVDQVNQEIIITQKEIEQLRNDVVAKLSQLGVAYAKATTQADKQNILNQKDAIINDYFTKKDLIIANHKQKIDQLLNKCDADKSELDKIVAKYNYLTGNSLISGDANE
ncbi:MAG: hypothetical protein JHC38_08885 [Thiotrichales bacterium]|jgi:hypothetical protein|nr:hypothetical protein [Thiotrichales bacterium]